MADHHAQIVLSVTYALWPGDGVFCVRIAAPKLCDQFLLVDRDGRRSELRPYVFGTVGGRR